MTKTKMRRFSSLCVGVLCSISVSYAQTIIPDEALLLPQTNTKIDVSVDRQPNTQKIGNLRSANPPIVTLNTVVVVDERDGKAYNIIPTESAILQGRLKLIEGVMPMTYNNTTSQFIDFFMRRRPSFTKEMLEKKDFYFPVFEKYLAKYNMPDELKYLALIESGLNPKAVSRSKAVGLWQFMSPTGREQGLVINDYVDERMHIEKSTDAACRYLRTLYGMFHDWELALAAYNSGPGTIRRALRRSGRTDYWEIHNFIPRDTRTYVPQWTAIAYMMNYSADHNIFAENILYPIASRPIKINGYLDLQKFAELTFVDYNQIQLLNPHIKLDKLPPHTRNLEIRLPLKGYDYFTLNHVNILAEASVQSYLGNNNTSLAETTLANAEPVAAVTSNKSNGSAAKPVNVIEDLPTKSSSGSTRAVTKTVTKYHKVRRGENLSTIADRYNVYIKDVKRWNNLRSSKILVGQRLKMYVKETQYVNTEGNAVIARNSPSKISTPSKYYTVRNGDTLWSISQRYSNISINDIKRLNNMRSNTVKVGQRLKIGGTS
jgi:membrane-bound lytic murein transglycosylase D